ncbi:hypothetical protein MLD38_013406 [Melastoma candidum]|uniref:Uncharacterized protein n=1 Tax=Melastoma candidum TaxID=119954 RepID=A0ACB9R9J3_9MYRT|nr:hypothetical protein MLD38_013406 [Melastoma candidum]
MRRRLAICQQAFLERRNASTEVERERALWTSMAAGNGWVVDVDEDGHLVGDDDTIKAETGNASQPPDDTHQLIPARVSMFDSPVHISSYSYFLRLEMPVLCFWA